MCAVCGCRVGCGVVCGVYCVFFVVGTVWFVWCCGAWCGTLENPCVDSKRFRVYTRLVLCCDLEGFGDLLELGEEFDEAERMVEQSVEVYRRWSNSWWTYRPFACSCAGDGIGERPARFCSVACASDGAAVGGSAEDRLSLTDSSHFLDRLVFPVPLVVVPVS